MNEVVHWSVAIPAGSAWAVRATLAATSDRVRVVESVDISMPATTAAGNVELTIESLSPVAPLTRHRSATAPQTAFLTPRWTLGVAQGVQLSATNTDSVSRTITVTLYITTTGRL